MGAAYIYDISRLRVNLGARWGGWSSPPPVALPPRKRPGTYIQ